MIPPAGNKRPGQIHAINDPQQEVTTPSSGSAVINTGPWRHLGRPRAPPPSVPSQPSPRTLCAGLATAGPEHGLFLPLPRGLFATPPSWPAFSRASPNPDSVLTSGSDQRAPLREASLLSLPGAMACLWVDWGGSGLNLSPAGCRGQKVPSWHLRAWDYTERNRAGPPGLESEPDCRGTGWRPGGWAESQDQGRGLSRSPA